MEKKPSKDFNRPFKNLNSLLKRSNMPLAPHTAHHSLNETESSAISEDNESELFLKAMADVKPLACKNTFNGTRPPSISRAGIQDDDQTTMAKLHQLIQYGHGFVVSLTPEYMESVTPGAGADTLRRLHQGRYSIQDYVDLHGFGVQAAERELERFIKKSIERGYRAILVVHGRGLTSPKEPVLKNKVFSWLTKGRLGKWVIALTSARSCDGGAGATYVLLRRQSRTKRQRHRKTTLLDKR